MKKILALLLSVLLLFAFVGCEADESKEADGGKNGSQNATVTTGGMAAAAQKLTTASSYRFRIITIEDINGEKDERSKEYLVVKGKDGATILNQNNKGTDAEEKSKFYYEGKVGYVYDAHRTPTKIGKVISDTPFTFASLFEREELIPVKNDETGALAVFDSMKPTATKEKDGILYEIKNMTKDQFLKVYTALVNDQEAVDEMNKMPIKSFKIVCRADNNGYFKEFTFGITVEMDGQTATQELKFVVDGVNNTKIEKPDFVKEYKFEADTEVIYLNNGQDAHYYYEVDYNNNRKEIVCFNGFGTNYIDDYVVEQYKVLADVEGIKVTQVSEILANPFCSVKVKRLIIPAGVKLGCFSSEDDESVSTAFYFEDTKAKAKIDEEMLEYAKEIYYAGEWEYVDGIATPKK